MIQSNSQKIDIEQLQKSSATNKDLNKYYGLKFDVSIKNGKSQNYASSLVINENNISQAKVAIDNRYQETIFAQILPPKYSINTSLDALEKIIDNKQENQILSILKKIDKRICNISIVRDVIKIDIGLKSLIPINMMGDGIRKNSSYSCSNPRM